MSTQPEKKSLLAPLGDAYEPTEHDADRIFARIQASLLVPGAAAPSLAEPSPPPPSPDAGSSAGAGAPAGRHLWLVGLSCVVLAIVGGGAAILHSQPNDARVAPSVEASLAPPPVVVVADGNAAPRDVTTAIAMPGIPSISVDSLPSAGAPRATNPSASASAGARQGDATAAASPSDTLEKEARLLAEARGAVQRGDATQALALLDEHARVYPKGWLASDRAAEHIVVLCSLGRRDEAAREAKVFLAGRPRGPLTRRVTMSCAGEP